MNELSILEDRSVEAALKSSWKEATEINRQILKLDKNNLAATLRLGFANLQLSNFKEAKKYYQRGLKLQPANTVAKENLDRIKILQSRKTKKGKKIKVLLDPNLFLEVPGKTKSVVLVNLGQKNTLAQLSIGQEVFQKPKKRKVEIRTKNDEYVGSLPDDLSKRLLLFLKADSVYTVFVKEAILNRVVIFMKEEKKGKKVGNYLSFPQNSQSQIREISHDKDGDEDSEDVSQNELEKLAESLTSEDNKEYMSYHETQEDDEAEE